jgi:hypothetical protein
LDGKDYLSLGCIALAALGLIGGLYNRSAGSKGIGTKFIRYTALVVALPIAAAWVFQDMNVQAIAAITLGALGFAGAGVLLKGGNDA